MATTEFDTQVSDIKARIQKATGLDAKYQARLEEVQRRQEANVTKLRELGVDPEQLPSVIAQLKAQITTELANANAAVPSLQTLQQAEAALQRGA